MNGDLRQWLQTVESLGELRRVEGCHWDLELNAVMDLARRASKSPPAVLFDHLCGYPAGYRVLTGIVTNARRLALTLGLPLELSAKELVVHCKQKLHQLQLRPPRWVDNGPVLQHQRTGEQINLWEFPAPRWNKDDGGRYLGTGSVTITRDPATGWINLGTYRVMLHDQRTLGFYISPGKHGRMHREAYWEQGKPCPIAISFGHHPLFFLAAAMQVPYGTSEYDVVGGLAGEPVEVVRGPFTGLPVPAAAELVVEGEAIPGDVLPEGPFGEYTGYYASGARSEPVIRVHSIMYRDNPVLCACPPGKPPGEDTFFMTRLRSSLIWQGMERAGVPEIHGVCCHEVGVGTMFTVVALHQCYAGHAKQAASVAAECQGSGYMGRFVVVVDEDIDPFNLEEVLWAMATRCDPATSLDILHRCWSGPLDPAIPPEAKGFNSKALVDACRPYHWRDRFPPVIVIEPELRQRVRQQWSQALGLDQ